MLNLIHSLVHHVVLECFTRRLALFCSPAALRCQTADGVPTVAREKHPDPDRNGGYQYYHSGDRISLATEDLDLMRAGTSLTFVSIACAHWLCLV